MKKFLPYILILVILVGLFGLPINVNAAPDDEGVCRYTMGVGASSTTVEGRMTEQECADLRKSAAISAAIFIPDGGGGAIIPQDGTPDDRSEFEKTLDDDCSFIPPKIPGCIASFIYHTYFQVPAIILAIAASFFNTTISIALNSTMYSLSFISEAWVVVRDFSNIFFILILLYIAFKTILGLGGGNGPKKMIAQVIIMAMLINFSMFFTKIIIDSSNILALIFYNKLSTETTRPSGSSDKDISGEMYMTFDATRLVSKDFFDKAKEMTVLGHTTVRETVPLSIKIGMMFVAGTIMLFAAYTFFVAGISFLGRLIELWVLLIFSPFAFMSSIVPKLSKTEKIGWEPWFKHLLSTSFMAPIFMFFIYLIFKLIHSGLFNGFISGQGIIANILAVMIPALIVLKLLLKAAEYAKKGGGEFADMAIKGAKLAGGLVLGAGVGVAALGGTAALGGLAARAGASKGLQAATKTKGIRGFAARAALKTVDYGAKASFDARKIPGMGTLAKAGGLNLESASAIGLGSREGGYEQRRADQNKKRQKRAGELEVREDEGLKQNLNMAEEELQAVLNKVTKDFENIDKDLKSQRQKKADAASGSTAEAAAITEIRLLRAQKEAIKDGSMGPISASGKTIKELEDTIIPDAKNAILTENRDRKRLYADRITWGSFRESRERREAAHKIRMEVKLDSKEKT